MKIFVLPARFFLQLGFGHPCRVVYKLLSEFLPGAEVFDELADIHLNICEDIWDGEKLLEGEGLLGEVLLELSGGLLALSKLGRRYPERKSMMK